MSRLSPAQRAIVDDLSHSLCVTSGAGCGKTSVLVERYIRFLDEDLELGLDRLAAITFTENAAAEMRQRIRQACRTRMTEARGRGDAKAAGVWQDRYWDVDTASIDTIHAFCGGLLRRYAIEAGIDPHFALLDEAESTLIVDDLIRRTVEELLDDDNADLLAVLEHYSLIEVRDLLADVLKERREVLQRVAAPVMAKSDTEILRGLARAVDEAAAAALRQWMARPDVTEAVAVLGRSRGDAGDKIENVRAAAVGILGRLPKARTGSLALAAAQELTAAINLKGGSAKKWPSAEALAEAKAALKTIRETCQKVVDDLVPYDEEAERRHLALARAFYRTSEQIIAAYQTSKTERPAFDFEDLQIHARDLLKNENRVCEECRRRYRAILVDELQDTNSLQFEIVNLLVSGPGGRGREVVRPGALFGVGDPKQSIYRFRGAEFEVFQKALDRVGPDGRRTLAQSFRLHPGTAALVNQLFPPLMPGQYEPVEGKHEQKNAVVGEVLHVLSPDPKGLGAEEGHQQEARRLAARLKEIVEGREVTVWDPADKSWRPARYADAAVLLRRMSHLHLYEQALEDQGVPYYVVAGRGFFEQQEVRDVLALLRILDDPEDDLSLASVLRSPFFSVSDEGLYHLRQLGAPLHAHLSAGAAAEHLDAEDRRGLRRAADLLPRWAAEKDRMGLGALVDRTIFESGYAAAVVGKFGGERAYANLRQMVELARRFQDRGLSALGDYIAYVADFMKNEMRAEQASVDSAGADTVRLMTIHKAKGLEFPIVAVPDLGCAPGGRRRSFHVHRTTGLALRLRDEDGDGRVSAALAMAHREADEADHLEDGRLFYVALTRAKDYLILSSFRGYNRSHQSTWFDALLGSLGEKEAPGMRVVSLEAGPSLKVSFQPPDSRPVGRRVRRAGPRDLVEAGRMIWPRLHERGERTRGTTAAEALGRLRPVAVTTRPPSRIAATAVAEYARCAARYRWKGELGVEDVAPPDPPPNGLSRRAWGDACHRAMELAVSPTSDAIAAAVAGAVREIQAPTATRPDLEKQLRVILETFWASPLGRRAAAAVRTWREVPVLLAIDGTVIRGQIDLVFQGSDGRWELVDYKSSAPAPDRADEEAQRYALQLGLYALAASRWLQAPIERWSVYFLGSATVAEHAVTKADLGRIEAEAKQVLAGMAARRFDKANPAACAACDFASLCYSTSC
jgi:ATP-dependent helicase/nuclease subunit A